MFLDPIICPCTRFSYHVVSLDRAPSFTNRLKKYNFTEVNYDFSFQILRKTMSEQHFIFFEKAKIFYFPEFQFLADYF